MEISRDFERLQLNRCSVVPFTLHVFGRLLAYSSRLYEIEVAAGTKVSYLAAVGDTEPSERVSHLVNWVDEMR
jgi:hypothetical protein